jgi:hypothetical protein
VHSNQPASLAICKRLLLLHNSAANDMLSPEEQRSGGIAGRNPALAAFTLRQLTPALAAAADIVSNGAAAHDSRDLLPVGVLEVHHLTCWHGALLRHAQRQALLVCSPHQQQ